MGAESGKLSDLKGGDVVENMEILDRLLDGNGSKALENSIVINAAAAFFIVGRYGNILEGLPEARDLLVGGAVRKKIDQAKEFYQT